MVLKIDCGRVCACCRLLDPAWVLIGPYRGPPRTLLWSNVDQALVHSGPDFEISWSAYLFVKQILTGKSE